MESRRTIRHVVFTFTLLVGLSVGAALGGPGTGSGRADEAAAAGGVDLLAAPPFDRITLIDGTELRVEPVRPRPLPPPGPPKPRAGPLRRDGRPAPPP
ncbi:MAG TPA: hypothetical protein VF590_15325, partial [Isosphaeraceae bacterium]